MQVDRRVFVLPVQEEASPPEVLVQDVRICPASSIKIVRVEAKLDVVFVGHADVLKNVGQRPVLLPLGLDSKKIDIASKCPRSLSVPVVGAPCCVVGKAGNSRGEGDE